MKKNILVWDLNPQAKVRFAKIFSSLYNTTWVKSMQEYIDQLNREYVESDLKIIGERQLKIQSDQLKKTDRLLFCDTGLEVIKIWAEITNIKDATHGLLIT